MMAPVLAAMNKRGGKIQQRFNDQKGRASREPFLHGAEESQTAAGKDHKKNGKLFPHVFKRSILFFSDFAERGGNLVRCQHDEVLKAEHFPYQSAEKKRTHDRRQSLSLAYHEDAHAYVDAAENKQKMFSERFTEKPADIASDDGAEEDA